VQAEYRRTFVDLDCQIVTVRPGLLVMEFPSEEKIDRLSTRLNGDFGQRMLIYNMSERKYDTSKFQGEVVDVGFRGLPAPPVELLMELCVSAQQWLAGDEGNALVVHCFQGYSRSAVFMSCLLAFRGLCSHPSDALQEVCEKLGVDEAAMIVPSQRRYLSYFQQCQQELSPVRTRFRLLRVQLNGVPQFDAEAKAAFRPYVEVWSGGELIFTSEQRPGGAAASAQDALELHKAYGAGDSCVSIQPPADTFVAGDVLVRVRHIHADGTSRDTALRVAFHTGFIDAGLQLAKRELDSACKDSRFSDEFFLDLILEPAPELEGPAEPSPVFAKAREVSRQLRDKEAAAKTQMAKSDEADEVTELEETLRRSTASPVAGSAEGGSAAAPASNAADLRRALAEAAADDDAAVAAQPQQDTQEAAQQVSQPAAEAADSQAAEAAPAPPAPKAAAPAPEAAAPATSAIRVEAPATVETARDAVQGSQAEIDQLFSDFDAALDSVAAGASMSTLGATAGSTKAPSAGKEGAAVSSPPAADSKGPTKSTADDVFGDVDAFLKEFDS